MTPPPETPLGQLIHERMRALGIESRSQLFRRTGEFGGGVRIAQTTLGRWETDFNIQPEHDKLITLAHALADSNSEHDRAEMVERVFRAAGQPPPDAGERRINPRIARRLGLNEWQVLELLAERLAGLKANNIREGRELALAGEPASDEEVSDEDEAQELGRLPAM